MKTILFSSALCFPILLLGQSRQADAAFEGTHEPLLTQYVQSKGPGIISFDASNIKQFWIEPSIVSRKDSFDILLTKDNGQNNVSVPLRIQLMNVKETQDCKIEVIAETEDVSFSVLDGKSEVLSTSKKEDGFLHYMITSAVFHMEDTQKLSFSLKFNSKTTDVLSIKKIILMFSDNKESKFTASPGRINYTAKKISTSSNTAEVDSNSFSVVGKQTAIFSSQKIIISDKTLSCSVTIKNIGENATTVYVGYNVFTQDNISLNGRNYPFKNINKNLKVVSSSEKSNKIIVDAYTEWAKNCYLALNVKEDLSDIPNNTFLEGKTLEIKKLENGQAEITLDKPLKNKLKEGTELRVHGLGGAFLYTNSKSLQPGEEQVFNSTIQKDDAFLQYSSKAFSRGVYYVVPIILSYSSDPSKENTIVISDYTISY